MASEAKGDEPFDIIVFSNSNENADSHFQGSGKCQKRDTRMSCTYTMTKKTQLVGASKITSQTIKQLPNGAIVINGSSVVNWSRYVVPVDAKK